MPVGIRTDDELAIGYINPERIHLPADAGRDIVERFRPNGTCQNPADRFFEIYAISGGDRKSLDALTLGDRHYLLNWLFKFAQPEGARSALVRSDGQVFATKRGDGTWIANEAYIRNFGTSSDKRSNYKMLNHFQVKFLLAPVNRGFGSVWAVEQQTQRGMTTNPINFGPSTIDSQSGPADSRNGMLVFPDRVTSIADVSPDPPAVSLFNYIESGYSNTACDRTPPPMPPKLWTDVGCAITFRWDGGTQGSYISTSFPTFLYYRNGVYLQEGPQLAEPRDYFVTTPPWPFGRSETGMRGCYGQVWLWGGQDGFADRVGSEALLYPPPFVRDWVKKLLAKG